MPLEFADPELESILRNYRLESIHASDETVYVVRPDLTLVYVNEGWSKFAYENGGEPTISNRWPIGSSIADAIPQALRPFFTDKFSNCLQTRSPWQHRYECSSVEQYREFMMTIYPLGDSRGLLVVNSLFKNSQHDRVGHPPIEEWYRDESGMILQCVHCRRIKRPQLRATWDWVPVWVESYPQNMSHGLCEPCFGYFYPGGLPQLGGYAQFIRTGMTPDATPE